MRLGTMRPIDQQTIVVTGSTDGLGKRTAAELAGRGAAVVIHGRDAARGDPRAESRDGYEGVSGRYFNRLREDRAEEQAYDAAARRRLWRLSEELVGSQALEAVGPATSLSPGGDS